MHTFVSVALATAFSLPSLAAIPPNSLGFPIASSQLGVHFAKQRESTTPGQHYEPKVPAHAPKVSVDLSKGNHDYDESSKYVLAMVDADEHDEHHTIFGQPVHWLEKDLQISNKHQNDDPNTPLVSSHQNHAKSTIVPYKCSPAGSRDKPHRYLLYLFKQPEDLFLNKNTYKSRPNVDISEFAKEHALGEPLAANWFTSGGDNDEEHSGASSKGEPQPREQHLLEKRVKVTKIGKKLKGHNKNKQSSSTMTPASTASTMSSSSSSSSSSASAGSTGGAAAIATAVPARGMAAAALGAAGVALVL